MSPNARRGCSKIVAPSTPNRGEELIGGLKNALERGETLAKAKQSFISAGYKPAEIETAVKKMPTGTLQTKKQIIAPSETPIKPQTTNPLSTIPTSEQPEKLSKKSIIILISISVIILIGAAILGIFWDKITG